MLPHHRFSNRPTRSGTRCTVAPGRSAFPVTGPGRNGAATVETALLLLVWLLLLIGTLDLSLVLFRHTFTHHLATTAARLAAVHGANAAPQATPWGPMTVQVTLSDTHPVADLLRPLTGGLSPADFLIRLEWPDGGNNFDQRVRVTVITSQATALGSLFPGNGSVPLQATSLARITY